MVIKCIRQTKSDWKIYITVIMESNTQNFCILMIYSDEFRDLFIISLETKNPHLNSL